MDLIQAYYSDSEPEDVQPVVQNEPDAEPDVQPEAPNAEARLEEKKRNKKMFKKKLVAFPNRPIDIWECKHCDKHLNRRSINRHIKIAHPEMDKFKWRFNVEPVKDLVPSLKSISWRDTQRSSIKLGIFSGKNRN